ncbi:hypothetical protein GR925_24330 [Streptomyces sp. HUCO-GS316]|uniref:hypothetical protein n=1 Tax=Streptomyces sp. HUCO-GS316 TaxID=2692198 RepID=UPI00136BC02C|nr:hypothetical protein [Streptomyces sp. HUCO-GS316]MXM66469.1 hypothetical protein [Streptomyces sp. HUCO-GS316]
MFRGKTARTLLALLAAVLLALTFFAPTASFASAHTVRQVEAKTPPGIKPSGTALPDEAVTFRHCGHSGDPTGPLHSRDRHRAVDSAPEDPERPPLVQDPAAPTEPPAHRDPRTSRLPTAHSAAALQVFRC